MGVRGLETFIKTKVENGTAHVEMEKMIRSHKQGSGKEALIVVDVEGMLQSFVTPEEMMCGLRSDVYCRRVRAFFQRLIDAGAQLVFFTDGPVQNDKQPTWMRRQNVKYDDHLAVIDKLDKHVPLRDLVNLPLPTTTMVSSLLRAVAKEFGPLTSSIHNECDLELAAYATKNNAYAIMADDSDFLIYPGNWRYWSIKHIDDEHFTTLAYNRVALRAHLGLSSAQMPLFAALGGNDIVQFEDIKGFHQRIGWRDKFDNIAHYVRPLPLNLTDEILENIAYDVFSHKNDWKRYTSFLKNGIEIYDIDSITTENLSPFLMKLLDHHLKTVYVILKESSFSVTAMYDDMRDKNKKSYCELALEMRSKAVGVIMKHRNDPKLQMKVVVKLSHEEPYRQVYITPKYPEIEVPPLERFLFPEDEDDMDAQRKELFKWILSGTKNIAINTDRLFALPKDYICPVATLFYLVKEANFSIADADIILLSIYWPYTIHQNLNDTDPPEYLLKDAFTASFLYLKMHNFIKRIFRIVGLGKHLELIKFDGFVFHKLHQMSPLWDETERRDWMGKIEHLRLYAD